MAKNKVTIAEIARRVGLSSTTVSFALNNNRDKGLSPATVRRVLAAASELGYVKTTAAKLNDRLRVAFVTGKLAFFNFHTSFFAGVYSHLQSMAMERKLELFLTEIDLAAPAEIHYRQFIEVRAMGIDVFVTHSIPIAQYLEGHGFDSVLFQSGGILPNHICVYCDDFQAGRLAALHALEMGHRRAGMIFPHMESPRAKGFLEAYLGGGGECPEPFRWDVQWDHERMAAEIRGKAGMPNLPSLFYCFADNVMFPAIQGFAAAGLKVPDDVSLIGTDNLYWGKVATPPFTTVDLKERLFAEKVLEAIFHLQAGDPPYQLAVPVELLSRGTVKRLA